MIRKWFVITVQVLFQNKISFKFHFFKCHCMIFRLCHPASEKRRFPLLHNLYVWVEGWEAELRFRLFSPSQTVVRYSTGGWSLKETREKNAIKHTVAWLSLWLMSLSGCTGTLKKKKCLMSWLLEVVEVELMLFMLNEAIWRCTFNLHDMIWYNAL